MAKDRMRGRGNKLLAGLELVAGVILCGIGQCVPPVEAIVLELEAIGRAALTLFGGVGKLVLEVIGHEDVGHDAGDDRSGWDGIPVVMPTNDGTRIPMPGDDAPGVGAVAIEIEQARVALGTVGHIEVANLELAVLELAVRVLDAPASPRCRRHRRCRRW